MVSSIHDDPAPAENFGGARIVVVGMSWVSQELEGNLRFPALPRRLENVKTWGPEWEHPFLSGEVVVAVAEREENKP